MTRLIAQHGAAKGQKITDGLMRGTLSGAIFSPNDENVESIIRYVKITEGLDKNNSYLDPQFYFSTFESTILKKLGDVGVFPSNIVRRDWRKKSDNILNYIDYHAKQTNEISDTLITPGFYIDNIDWHFDYSIDMYNYCVENFDFKKYCLSLLISSSFFNNKSNVDEMIEEIDEVCIRKDYIYLTICYDTNGDNNYEDMDPNCLGNILYMIYSLQKMGFKFIIGYTFMNSILFAMLGCELVGSGWFNTLRKFQKNKFEQSDSFGRRKKRYTSIPLLSFITFDNLNDMIGEDKVEINEVLSGCSSDSMFVFDKDMLSFVDLEHQYWESLSSVFNVFDDNCDIVNNIEIMKVLINEALQIYRKAIDKLNEEDERIALNRIKSSSKHLTTWLLGIEVFKSNVMIL
ncbi:hypothetical protein [Turicibacter sanguinis]|uniref:hypothetical protein n=1 Tax=Turicibacter sanguinis TaxID=154288 RepID=UPI0018AA33FD|nr:hypothetical protein [Turicibacter sanguinis]